MTYNNLNFTPRNLLFIVLLVSGQVDVSEEKQTAKEW